ncbi:CocE/NonD family hydrolase [Spirosoma telluris]|uniref:CocE/NonD family hydrolase n=1 Tax=Spirosoma telluris TaxID=2183553 RepID=UPI002FC34608
MTPIVSDRKKPSSSKLIDESTDTYDTIDWLLRHVHYHNGRVGLWGMSYAGFYAIAGSINAHPALKASSPQAPIADFFREDIHHNGAFTQLALLAYPLFGEGPSGPTTKPWFLKDWIQTGDQTEYAWHTNLGRWQTPSRIYPGMCSGGRQWPIPTTIRSGRSATFCPIYGKFDPLYWSSGMV